MRRTMTLMLAAGFGLATSFGLAGCGQSAEEPAEITAVSEAAKPKRPSFCFFKDAETEKWSASRDSSGNVVVKGRAFRSDPRYKAELGPAEVSGDAATISPTIVQNKGYASPDNWWDVTASIPDSAAVTRVTVACGKTTLGEFNLAPKS